MWVMGSLVNLLSKKAKEDDIEAFTFFIVQNLILKNNGLLEDVLMYLNLSADTDILELKNRLKERGV